MRLAFLCLRGEGCAPAEHLPASLADEVARGAAEAAALFAELGHARSFTLDTAADVAARAATVRALAADQGAPSAGVS